MIIFTTDIQIKKNSRRRQSSIFFQDNMLLHRRKALYKIVNNICVEKKGQTKK